jgi:hypothetical protein
MTTPQQPEGSGAPDTQPDFSDVEGYLSDSEGEQQQDGLEARKRLAEVINARPGRQSTDIPQPVAGHGLSTYGPPAQQLPVARNGLAAGLKPFYREDRDPLYHWGKDGPEITFTEGIRNKSNLAPTSLLHHQNTHRDSALVSFTRNPDPNLAPPEARDPESGVSYRTTTLGSGGYDLVTSLATAGKPEQEGVARWKGEASEFVARTELFDQNKEHVWTQDNPAALPAVKAELTRLDRQAREQRVREAAERAKAGKATPYDQLRHQYADQYTQTVQHAERRGRTGGHSAIVAQDGNARAYAEWWHENRNQPTVQEYAKHWAKNYGTREAHAPQADIAHALRTNPLPQWSQTLRTSQKPQAQPGDTATRPAQDPANQNQGRTKRARTSHK